jgi:pimeloyl-ACP methyl ester carboxylesterase
MKPDNRLFVHKSGKGPAIVLLHGMVGSSRYWDDIAAALSPTHTVIAVDLLGFGKSPKPADASYTVDEHIAALRRTLERQRLTKPFVVVGHSMGGLLAAAYAQAYPNEVRKLVMLSTPLFKNQGEARRVLSGSKTRIRMMLYGPSARMTCWMMCRLRPLARLLAPLYLRKVPMKVARDMPLHTWRSYSRSMENILECQVYLDFSKLGMPTTVAYGLQDDLIIPGNINELRTHPNITIHEFNATHHLPLEAPISIVALISGRTKKP